MILLILKKILYEFWKDRKSNISYFYIFSYQYFILNNNKNNLHKFDVKSDEDIFFRYSTSCKPYKVFNKLTLIVEESIYIVFDKTNDLSSGKKDIINHDVEILKKEIKKLNLKERTNQDGGEETKNDE